MVEMSHTASDDQPDPDDQQAFWESRPAYAAGAPRTFLDDHLVIWPETSGPGFLDRAASVVSRFIDGTTTAADLAADFAWAADIPPEHARRLVVDLITHLHRAGQLEPMSVPTSTLSVPEGDAQPSNDLDEVVGVGHGDNPPAQIVEELPDGRKRVTTQFSLTTSGTSNQARIAAEALTGQRSLVELVPPDSCLGFKLRLGEDVDVVSGCVSESPMSIRSDHPDITPELRSVLAGPSEGGPVVAFVVAPFEGDGPCRVFDAAGRRRGRPRTTSEVVDLVRGIVAERVSDTAGHPTRLRWAVLCRGSDAVLVSPALLELPRVGAAARARGIEFFDVQPLLNDDGSVTIDCSDDVRPLRVKGVLFRHTGDVALGPLVLEDLLLGTTVEDPSRRSTLLEAAATLVAGAELVRLDTRSGAEVVDRASQLLGAPTDSGSDRS